MNLSARLTAAAGLITPGSRLADVGTDHGFVPIALVEKGVIPSAIAMDVNRGPLARAAEHVREAGMESRIDIRLSDGIEKLEDGEADTVLIAGMGGALTVRILEAGLLHVPSLSELVLQPQSELSKVRRFLERNGWKIDREDMVLEDGKFYPMMQVHRGEMTLKENEAEYGPILISESHPVLAEYLAFELRISERNLDMLRQTDSKRTEERITQIRSKIHQIRDLRNDMIEKQRPCSREADGNHESANLGKDSRSSARQFYTKKRTPV